MAEICLPSLAMLFASPQIAVHSVQSLLVLMVPPPQPPPTSPYFFAVSQSQYRSLLPGSRSTPWPLSNHQVPASTIARLLMIKHLGFQPLICTFMLYTQLMRPRATERQPRAANTTEIQHLLTRMLLYKWVAPLWVVLSTILTKSSTRKTLRLTVCFSQLLLQQFMK